ncbi:high affinity immunoglobulin gamma Fc receptor I-like [Aquarana catesbeiana]|uniref:high affinity immunoglobulin gamma Fc receptor I-like n=1 Tax=Aquarana catesbeiana TaxID=8400 RepID=UPI003CC9746E
MHPEITVLLVLFLVEKEGSAKESSAVTFIPCWNKIFQGETITMTCDVKPASPVNMSYSWYKDNNRIHTGQSFVITSAETTHTGNYQCEGDYTGRSDLIPLHVSKDWVILQVPLHVYEGDDVTLRCHHYPRYSARETKFYKDNVGIRNWESDSVLHIRNITMERSGRYKCKKEVYHNLLYYKHTGEDVISVKELFTWPEIMMSHYPVLENDTVTLTCKTNLSSVGQKTKLLFAFYRDEQNVQKFGLSSQYEIQSAYMKDSGNYICEVKAKKMLKRSKAINIEIISKKKSATKQNIVRLIISGIILIIAFVFIFYHVKFMKRLNEGSKVLRL